MSEETDHPEKSFIEAKRGFELFSADLKPYSASRKVAAQAMGMRWPFIGEDALAQFQATNMYPGAIRDCIIVLWLCSIQDPSEQSLEAVKAKEWNPSRALSKPDDARTVALEWADKAGITDPTGPKFAEAFQVFFAIVSGVDAASFTLERESKIEGSYESGKV